MRKFGKSIPRALADGRDEMNLAEFPISVLQRQQPVLENGVKRDTATYEASRYDPNIRQRVQQRVVLETNSRHGLPTPADENVVLALLYVAKHTNNFTDPVVPFSPRQLFHIMGWAPNSRSYDRLRDVLRRLKALVIRYENSWWDIEGRNYEAEFATGIISEYEIGRQVNRPSERETASQDDRPALRNWVRWTPHFQHSLSKGNLKKLDLERLFSLRLPTSQRMYRFLDKRFYPRYQPPVVDMDLQDFACGHIGLTQVNNVAELKRRLAPAIAELEEIGFIAPADPAGRYTKIRAGVWRVRFRVGPKFSQPSEAPAVHPMAAPAPPRALFESVCAAAAEATLVTAFYQAWHGQVPAPLGEKDLQQARDLLQSHPPAKALALVPLLVQIIRRRWPECRSFSGAVAQYLPDALRAFSQRQQRAEQQEQERLRQQEQRDEMRRRVEEKRRLEARWQALPEGERQAIEQAIVQQYPEHQNRPAILRGLCLDYLARPAEGEG
jgi:Replication initiator protein A